MDLAQRRGGPRRGRLRLLGDPSRGRHADLGAGRALRHRYGRHLALNPERAVKEPAKTCIAVGSLAGLTALGLCLLGTQRQAPASQAATDSTSVAATLELVTATGSRRFTLDQLRAAIPAETAFVA